MRRPQTKLKVPDMGSVTTASKEAPALGITWQVGIDDRRQLVIQTFIERDCGDEELASLLNKCTNAGDHIARTYELRGYHIEKAGLQKELARLMEDRSNTEDRWREEHARRGRRGPFELAAPQLKYQQDNTSMQEQRKQRLSRIEAEIEAIEAEMRNPRS